MSESAAKSRVVVLLRDPADPIAASAPVTWAESQLAEALEARGVTVMRRPAIDTSVTGVLNVHICSLASPEARAALSAAALNAPNVPEGLALVPARDRVLVSGYDQRGLVYAVLELVDRVATSLEADPLAGLHLSQPVVQRPANAIRGVARLFVSNVEDLRWFHDRDFWGPYLTHLVAQRFNRFHLAFGIGHDFLRNVLDAYLLFAYPFLVDVPGYQVRVPGLTDAERSRNLDALRFASDQAAARGLHFQLGLWTHAYEWIDSPNASHQIEGLTPQNHAAYCRDALRLVLQACPSISGVTFRVHGESGVPEGNYDFWREVFRGATTCGREMELDLHPKGVGPEMIQVGLDTGLPVRLSPKYTAEHMGLPGHQVAIRELERTGDQSRERDAFVEQLMNQSASSLRYTRYGSADFLREDRRYGVFYRIWPGTQRLLLWGDAALAAGFGRSGSFCDSLGVELCEPLSFKGRRGSGLRGGREAYEDRVLQSEGGADWEKFRLTYRFFGRLLYDPCENPSVWRRALANEFGAAAAEPVEAALGNASRMLPLITSAYHPSAANNRYWPEVYTNLPIVDAERPHPYRDMPSPHRFGSASALDPGLFVGVDDFVREVTTAKPSGRISPVRVARVLDGLSEAALRHLERAKQTVADPSAPRFRRLAIDVSIEAGLGAFFAAKLRAGVAYALWQSGGDQRRLAQALAEYRSARAAWQVLAEHGRAYLSDITVGGEPWLRGHWSDRVTAIDADLADMQAEWERAGATSPEDAVAALSLDLLDPPPPPMSFAHEPPTHTVRGQPLALEVEARPLDKYELVVNLHYRHVNQAETYCIQPMRRASGDCFTGTIPATYTDSEFPLQYFFVLQRGALAWRMPDLDDDLANQTYWVVRQREVAQANR